MDNRPEQISMFNNYDKNWKHWANRNIYGKCWSDCKICYPNPWHQENDLTLFATKPEVENEIDFVLSKLLDGTAYTEPEAM